MRALRHHQRLLSFEQLEPRAMLSASPLKSAPPTAHMNLIAAATSTKSSAHAATEAALVQPAVVAPQPGDLNFDGKINAADFPEMMLALANPAAYEAKYQVDDAQRASVADVNQDGIVSNADLQALLKVIINTPPPPPPPPPQSVITPPDATVEVNSTIVQAANLTTPVVTAASTAPTSSPAAFVVGPSVAISQGAGGGGVASPAAVTVASVGPPMPSHVRSSDIALIAFNSESGGGADQAVEGMLLNLADVEEPQMLAIEYGDDVVKREVVVNKAVVPAPIEQPTADQPTAADEARVPAPAEIIASAVAPIGEPARNFFWQNYWWLVAIPVGAVAGAAAWTYRRRLVGNVGSLRRLLGL
jgi:hypothetical protein